MFITQDSKFKIDADKDINISQLDTSIKQKSDKQALKKSLKKVVKAISQRQEILYAQGKYSILLVFQAMDAAGKDSTIRAVMSGINPAGCAVHSFKKPSSNELKHDFLWRTTKALPERGMFGVFNRSHYEEVLVCKVHPEYLRGQGLSITDTDSLWQERYDAIVAHEKHLAQSNTIVLKFWLNVSQTEQHKRFLSRLEEPSKNWKFSEGDLAESKLWPQYMQAYADMLEQTSKPWAPWYAIPADNKPAMRLAVAQVILDNLNALPLDYPQLSKSETVELEQFKRQLK